MVGGEKPGEVGSNSGSVVLTQPEHEEINNRIVLGQKINHLLR